MSEPASVNYIRHQQLFYELVKLDARLHTSHISLYLALFQLWNICRFQNPFPVPRELALQLSRIGSVNTYTRCLKELDDFGYLSYQPAAQKGTFSRIVMFPLEQDMLENGFFPPPGGGTEAPAPYLKNETPSCRNNEIPAVKNDTRACLKIDTPATESSLKNDTRRVSKLRHLYKHINLKVNNEGEAPAPIKKNINQSGNAEENEKTYRAEFPFTPPAFPEVKELFSLAKYPAPEAAKFFHHYQANGWLQAGKTPIIDWRAAAHKWMLNILNPQNQHHDHRKYQPGSPAGRLHTREDKDYQDPL